MDVIPLEIEEKNTSLRQLRALALRSGQVTLIPRINAVLRKIRAFQKRHTSSNLTHLPLSSKSSAYNASHRCGMKYKRCKPLTTPKSSA